VQAIETFKKKLGADHPHTLFSIANLAIMYMNQGRWAKAEELFVQVIETRKKKLGADHPDTLASMASLALIWKQQGRDEEAVGIMRECVRLQQQRTLGVNHPYFISLLNALEAEQRDVGASAEGGVAEDTGV
jgi:tetratricopeptide (TPR) repeat protein